MLTPIFFEGINKWNNAVSLNNAKTESSESETDEESSERIENMPEIEQRISRDVFDVFPEFDRDPDCF